MTKRRFGWGLAVLAVSVAGCGLDSYEPEARYNSKLEVRGRLNDPGFVPTSGEDLCSENGWYGDGECDFWCPAADSDCAGDAVCAAYIEESDGLCQRSPMDPCRDQDPDCDVGCPDLPIFPGSDGVCSVDPNDPCVSQNDQDCQGGVTCARFIERPDGKCSRADDDACRFQDPDCVDVTPPVCIAIGQIADGVCTTDPSDPCVELSDPDCQTVCTLIVRPAPPSDGVCDAMMDPCAPPDPDCECSTGADQALPAPPNFDGVCDRSNPCVFDPDCDVVCAAFVEESDGVCSRDINDPCRSQDPDCLSCLTPGARPQADGVCTMTNDPCGEDPDCVTCAFFAPPPPADGICNGDPNDPCSFQGDPDCNVACALYIEVEDGQCSRFSNDPCISQDPDCTEWSCDTEIFRGPEVLCRFPTDSMCRPPDLQCPPNTDA